MGELNEQPASLLAILDGEIDALGRVLAALATERSALEARDADGLLAASNRKAEAVAYATRLERERREISAPRPGTSTADAAVDRRFGELLTLAARCREMNEANGLLIRGQRRRVESSLRLLRGGRDTAETYGRDGASRFSGQARGPLATY